MKAIKKNVLLQPSTSQYRGIIAVPETYKKKTSMCQVVSKGESVPSFIKEGATVIVQGLSTAKTKQHLNDDSFFVPYTDIYAVVTMGRVFPIGRKILVKRHNNDDYQGQVYIPAAISSQDQSLKCEIVEFGSHYGIGKKMDGVEKGTIVFLKDWSENMIELGGAEGDNGYYLIVDERDLDYALID